MKRTELKQHQRSGSKPKPALEQPLSWFSALADRVRLEEAAHQLADEHPELLSNSKPRLGCSKATQEAK